MLTEGHKKETKKNSNQNWDEETGPNKELYQNANGVVERMRKRRIQFYRHLLRMDGNRQTKESSSSSEEGKKTKPVSRNKTWPGQKDGVI